MTSYTITRRTFAAALASAPLSWPQAARAQAFPTRPIRITSSFPAGSGGDSAMRIVAEKMQALLGQPLVVDAKPGGNGFIAMAAFKQQPATGHDLLLADSGTLSIAPSVFKKIPYDPVKDLQPISLINRGAVFVGVGAGSSIKSIPDLIAAARSGSLSYASPGVGSFQQLGAEQFAQLTGTKMLHVPFRDAGQMNTSVATGDVGWVLTTYASAAGLLKAGRVRLLSTAASTRSPVAPEIPSLTEAGGPAGIDIYAWLALMTSAATPAPEMAQIQRAVRDAIAQPDVKQRLAAIGLTAESSTQAELRDYVASETRRYADIVRRLGISLD